MSDLLIRDVDDRALARLKKRAERNGRSLQKEVKLMIEQAAGADAEATHQMLDRWKKTFAGRKLASSAKLLREDRAR
ncbi:MAG: hypothetical protein GC162_01745 [Planctomycetes bacterium]|nr:hypothetical protein [Planctomycetota bacterium]